MDENIGIVDDDVFLRDAPIDLKLTNLYVWRLWLKHGFVQDAVGDSLKSANEEMPGVWNQMKEFFAKLANAWESEKESSHRFEGLTISYLLEGIVRRMSEDIITEKLLLSICYVVRAADEALFRSEQCAELEELLESQIKLKDENVRLRNWLLEFQTCARDGGEIDLSDIASQISELLSVNCSC